MDKFEDSLPVTKNQRFHGFKKLSLYNTAQDGSDIREAVAGEIFRGAVGKSHETIWISKK
jgi:hypothetical protein